MTHYLLRGTGDLEEMSTLTMRYMRGYFVVTAPDIEPVMSSRAAKQGTGAPNIIPSPIGEVGANSSKRATKPDGPKLV